MGLTVDEFVGRCLSAMDELWTVEEGQRFAAFALGVLSGAALYDRIVFPLFFVDDAASCRTMDEFRAFEQLLAKHRGVN